MVKIHCIQECNSQRLKKDIKQLALEKYQNVIKFGVFLSICKL